MPIHPGLVEVPPTSQASLISASNYNPSYLIENTLTYGNVLAGKHSLTALVGQSAQQFNYSYLGASRAGYLRNDLQVTGQGPISAQINNYGGNDYSRPLSYFARVNYDFAGKCLLSATGRFDGSSRFTRDQSIGFFPGVSAGWRISEEGSLYVVASGGYGFNVPEKNLVSRYGTGDTRRAAGLFASGAAYPDGQIQPATLVGNPNGYSIRPAPPWT